MRKHRPCGGGKAWETEPRMGKGHLWTDNKVFEGCTPVVGLDVEGVQMIDLRPGEARREAWQVGCVSRFPRIRHTPTHHPSTHPPSHCSVHPLIRHPPTCSFCLYKQTKTPPQETRRVLKTDGFSLRGGNTASVTTVAANAALSYHSRCRRCLCCYGAQF